MFLGIARGLLTTALLATAGVEARTLPNTPFSAAFRQDQILVQPRSADAQVDLARLHRTLRGEVLQTVGGTAGLQIVRVPEGETVPQLVAKYQRSGLVAFAEPDYLGQLASTTPNDPKFVDGTLWGLNKIEAPAGWDELTSASNILVAVLDTGVRYTHEDLAANMWVDPVRGGPGLNALVGNNDPSDDSGHGTMVTGVLGALGNNGKRVVGVAWKVQIMACKCFDNFGVGSVSACVTCLDYARTNHARVVNASWGFGVGSLALSNAFVALRSEGILVVAAAGNAGWNLDDHPSYPASYGLDNIVTVAHTTRDDTLAPSSNFSAMKVHIGAPGDQIYSTFGATDSFYYFNSGTSFAAPYVSGALALLCARFPADSYRGLVQRLLVGSEPLPSLAGKCTSGGRLNLRLAVAPRMRLALRPSTGTQVLPLRVTGCADRPFIIQAASNLTHWASIRTNSTSVDGIFDFEEPNDGLNPSRFFRVITLP